MSDRETAHEVRKKVAKKGSDAAAEAAARPTRRPQAQMHDDDMDGMHVTDENGIDLGIGFDLENEATEWRHFSNLQTPPERPGYVQRWLRVRLAGKTDSTNVSRKFREGWRPRRVNTLDGGHALPTIRLAQFGLCIGVDDVVLCEMPARVKQQRDEYYEEQRRKQNRAIQTKLDDFGARQGQPIQQTRQTKVTNKEPLVADD